MDLKKTINQIKIGIGKRDKQTAIMLAKKLTDSLDITEYPVPIVKIMTELGFYIYSTEMPDDNISGFIMISPDIVEKTGSDRIIGVSDDDVIGRQRFTIAHEFAHYLFDFDEQQDTFYFDTYAIDKSEDDRESVPSRFAAEFLMPEQLFVKRFGELKKKMLSKYDLVSSLVEDFQVSRKAVERRCDELKTKIDWEN